MRSRWSARGRALVYAVSVEGQHEFFANGVLVSNCDSGLYSWRAAQHYLHREEPDMPRPGTESFARREAKLLEQRVLEKLNQKSEWWEPGDAPVDY